ncbi:MAG: UDP-N-acetylmuramoyl-tripeptide--D-alanyl-D-alanine ligase [bacterium]
MKISDILLNIEYKEIFNKIDCFIDSFIIDSRIKANNSLYIGIVGDKFNGGHFYTDAFNNGAVCCIVQDIDPSTNYDGKFVILVEDSSLALEQLAIYKRSILNTKIIAITGSAGKTGTKDLIHSALSDKFKVFKTPGNKNNHIGLPMSLLSIKDEDIAVLEMGMNHFNEISYLTKIAQPDIAVINNIGTCHIGNLGSRENICKAKLEILEGLSSNGLVIVNNDDDLLNKWASDNSSNYNICTYAIHNESDISIEDIKLDFTCSTYMYNDVSFTVPIPGIQYVSNSLPAILIGSYFDQTIDSISQGMKNLIPTENRMDITESEEITIINDTYNSNYDAVLYGIKILNNFYGRKIACLGDMLELGDFSNDIHKKLGTQISSEEVDILILVGENIKYTYESAKSNGLNVVHFNTNKEASDYINSIKKSEDIIFVKASQGMKFIEIVNAIK